ncbi:hypothetical protein GCM10011349_39230 [Novosphingobium indicum]|uniref:Uncharacterized protein n=1 Tax=Novosphingobium indicum TaxID=462949 RepID=A0ABQ2K130_9SPHN|nr:hypothetical protein GCM10011349_39230 [Novosphingobium indicum]
MEILDQIEGYLARTGTKASMFGRVAVGDPRFVRDLRDGRRPRQKTKQRVICFLASADAETREESENVGSIDLRSNEGLTDATGQAIYNSDGDSDK